MALLHGLHVWRDRFGIELVVAHLNHLTRGDDSDADAAWVHRLCEQRGIPCIVAAQPVTTESIRDLGSFEAAARKLRYDFLAESAVSSKCTAVVVAHTTDDQAETILHHVLRGTGPAGLAGMPMARELTADVQLLRPILGINRATLIDWLRDIGQDYREDATNADTRMTRNRLRHVTLPALTSDYNPQLASALCRMGQQVGELQEFVDHTARELLKLATIECGNDRWRLDRTLLAEQPAVLLRTLFNLLWRDADWPRSRMLHQHWQGLADLTLQPRGTGMLTLPEVVARRVRKEVVLERLPR